MRLIDADELMEHAWRDKLNSRELIAEMIAKAPTIKEIPTKIPIGIFEKLVSQEQKWISVKDKMPKDGEWVLCQLDDEFYDENTMMVLYHTDDWGEKWVDGGLGTGSYDVCAWMPLPKPYKEDNNG